MTDPRNPSGLVATHGDETTYPAGEPEPVYGEGGDDCATRLGDCPFCGSEPDTVGRRPWPETPRKPDTMWVARCGNPGCEAEVLGRTPVDAARRWNQRPTNNESPRPEPGA